jgi:hypothetical protein
MTPEENDRLAIRLFGYICAAIGGQASPKVRDELMAHVRDGPNRVLELAHEGDVIFAPAVVDAGTQLRVYFVIGGTAVMLVEVNAKNLGVSDETLAEWGRMAAEAGAVHVHPPDSPEGLQNPDAAEEGRTEDEDNTDQGEEHE